MSQTFGLFTCEKVKPNNNTSVTASPANFKYKSRYTNVFCYCILPCLTLLNIGFDDY